jgi:hypothetical protein
MKEFIRRWSNWWILNLKRKQLDDAFEKELNELIEREVALRIHGSLPYTQKELDEYIEELIRWVHQPPASLMHIVAEWVTKKFVEGRSEKFVCGHPPKRTYLLNDTWHCEECGGKWKSIANK